VRTARAERRLFLINPGSAPTTVAVPAAGSIGEIDRMTPFDPTGAGRTLDAPDMRIDGRAVAADGTFPGLQPTAAKPVDGRLPITLTPGEAVVVTLHDYAETTADVGASAVVPATLSLSLGTPASFAEFTPGADRTYQAGATATVISTAGDATLSVVDPSATASGRLTNGSFALAEPLEARGSSGTFAALSTTPLPIRAYDSPVSNDAVAVAFRQHIGRTEALRTGTYAKTLTFALSTNTP